MASRPPPRKRVSAAPAGDRELEATRREAADCRACPLWKPATQTVFGEGPAHARIMFVGEQPGDQEDIAGRPFVGPAGKLLDRALEQAGIDRRLVYVTNAVKHFKFELRGSAACTRSRPTRKSPPACNGCSANSIWLPRNS